MEWTTIDKTEWPDGEWKSEPDKVQWVDEATGLNCLAVRHAFGHWCGYVGVHPDHAFFEKNYGEVSGVDDEYGPSVHGGLTFSNRCADSADESRHICHVPRPGEPEVWWFGFDCAHSGDFSPGMPRSSSMREYEEYRTLAYVRGECAVLAEELKELEEDA